MFQYVSVQLAVVTNHNGLATQLLLPCQPHGSQGFANIGGLGAAQHMRRIAPTTSFKMSSRAFFLIN